MKSIDAKRAEKESDDWINVILTTHHIINPTLHLNDLFKIYSQIGQYNDELLGDTNLTLCLLFQSIILAIKAKKASIGKL